MSFILHGIALFLFLFASLFAAAFGQALEAKTKDRATVCFILAVAIGGCAFTLQVIA